MKAVLIMTGETITTKEFLAIPEVIWNSDAPKMKAQVVVLNEDGTAELTDRIVDFERRPGKCLVVGEVIDNEGEAVVKIDELIADVIEKMLFGRVLTTV